MFYKGKTFASDFHLVFDNFLSDWDQLREHCDTLDFAGVENPEDGVFYPDISLDVPTLIRNDIISQLIMLFCSKINISRMFFRLSKAGVKPPHFAHTDTLMNEYALMLYMNRADRCVGGTSFLEHKQTGMNTDPKNDKEHEVWERDTNDHLAWVETDIVNMKPNRALIFNSSKMHGAIPKSGFGNDATDGRLLLTAFFSVGDNGS